MLEATGLGCCPSIPPVYRSTGKDMTESQLKIEHQELVDNVLFCFFSTCGESSREQFENDAEFGQSLKTAALSSMAIIALACTEDDEAFQEQAPRFVGHARNDSDEVALLRLFTLDNFVTDSIREIKGTTARLGWFRNAYIAVRGDMQHSKSIRL